MGIVDKIKDIENEIARTQKNKATEYHLGLLRAKLAKLRTELLDPSGGKSSGSKGEGFDVKKAGDARVALIGFPSVGKSTLLSTVTKTESEAASYEFTTLTCIPGNLIYNETKIQLLDLPGIIEGAAHGEGRGRQVIAVAKSADLVLIVLDASRENEYQHKRILERELETVGLRLNKRPPNVTVQRKAGGGLIVTATVTLTHLGDDPKKTVLMICKEYRIHHAIVLIREDVTAEELIDVIEGNRKYVRCLYVYNKIDQVTMELVDEMARRPDSAVISCQPPLGIDRLLQLIWDNLRLVRVYTKRTGQPPDLKDPVVLTAGRGGVTVRDACDAVHRSLAEEFKVARCWGRSVRHSPQDVSLRHQLQDEDVLQIQKKTVTEEKLSDDHMIKAQRAYDKIREKRKK